MCAQVVAHVLMFVDLGDIPLGRNGEKQRARLRDAFVAGDLRPTAILVNRRL